MKHDDFESKLSRQPMRQIPPEWRREILRDAGAMAPATASQGWWREWLWPCPQAWAGLAAVWLVILVWHVSSAAGEPGQPAVARVEWRELRRQDELLARLLAPPEPPEPAEPPKPAAHAPAPHRREGLQLV